MKKLFEGKRILITGGTGFVGSEIASELLGYEPKAIRIFDNDESGLFQMQNKFGNCKNMRFFLGDIRDKERLRYAAEDVDIIFHAAAFKHVSICEYNPFEAVKSNVMGTQNLIDVAIDRGVKKVIFTSSDKAVNPTSTMGTTKLLCEKLITSANYYKGSRDIVFSSVRFGNVLDSSGSALPLFKQQISRGEAITITEPAMTRFVMSVRQTTNLIFRCVDLARGGEVFILKMPALNIKDLAEVMVEELAAKSGRKPSDIKIKFIGKKPGEKLYEELMTEEEIMRSFETEDMFIILPQIIQSLQEGHNIMYRYENANPTKIKNYTSKDTRLLTKNEIGLLLRKENLL